MSDARSPARHRCSENQLKRPSTRELYRAPFRVSKPWWLSKRNLIPSLLALSGDFSERHQCELAALGSNPLTGLLGGG